jgi:hypothetical protein
VKLIITPTFTKYERYCDTLVLLMDQMWPGHPEIWFFTDGSGISHKNTIQIPNANWTQILHDGLQQLRSTYPDLKHVYLVLEDLYPLWACRGDTLEQTRRVAEEAELDVVFFFADGSTPDIDSEILLYDLKLQVLPSWYRYYTSLQPALWKFDYLMEVTEYALARGIGNPWEFEFINLGKTHYKSVYDWPCPFSGLFKEGRVNLNALRHLKAKGFGRFRRQLLAQYVRQLPGYAANAAAGRLRRGLTRVLHAGSGKLQ